MRCAWDKFRELSPILTARGVSLKVRGKVYRACVESVMVYGNETWVVKVEDERKLESRENDGQVDVRSKLWDKIDDMELCRRLSIEEVVDVMRRGRLR